MDMTLNWNVRERLSVLRPRLFGRRVGCGDMGLLCLIGLVLAGGAFGCGQSTRLGAGLTHADTAVHAGATFQVADRDLHRPVTIIAYGDMRFTDQSNVTATNPSVRQALVARLAEENPDVVLLNGDVPWHGGNEADYSVYRAETKAWRDAHLRVFRSEERRVGKECRSRWS